MSSEGGPPSRFSALWNWGPIQDIFDVSSLSRALFVEGTDESEATESTPVSSTEFYDAFSTSIIPNQTTSDTPTSMAQRPQPDHTFSLEPLSNAHASEIPPSSIHDTLYLPVSVLSHSNPPPSQSEALNRELMATTSNAGPLARILANVDDIKSNVQSGFNGIQKVMERNRGEISQAREELSVVRAEEVEIRSQGTLFIRATLLNV